MIAISIVLILLIVGLVFIIIPVISNEEMDLNDCFDEE